MQAFSARPVCRVSCSRDESTVEGLDKQVCQEMTWCQKGSVAGPGVHVRDSMHDRHMRICMCCAPNLELAHFLHFYIN